MTGVIRGVVYNSRSFTCLLRHINEMFFARLCIPADSNALPVFGRLL